MVHWLGHLLGQGSGADSDGVSAEIAPEKICDWNGWCGQYHFVYNLWPLRNDNWNSFCCRRWILYNLRKLIRFYQLQQNLWQQLGMHKNRFFRLAALQRIPGLACALISQKYICGFTQTSFGRKHWNYKHGTSKHLLKCTNSRHLLVEK